MGYTVDVAGNLYRNGIQKKPYIHNGYFIFNFREGKKNRHVSMHRLQGYQKYGEAIFLKGAECRHQNSNSLDNSYDNILIGTSGQNKMDVPKEIRVERARHAGSFNRVFTDEQVIQIFEDHSNGMSYKKLSEKYQTCKGTLSYLFNKALYRPT